MTELEVLVGELVAVDGLATSAVVVGELKDNKVSSEHGAIQTKLLTSPPWSMNWGITRWKPEPA